MIVAALLAFAVLLAWLRLVHWQTRAAVDARTRGWRLALLFALQPLAAGLLYLTLVPPPLAGTAGTLIVATAGTPRFATMTAGEMLVALPEAPALPGAERVPDLATALRRHPDLNGLRVIGEGLPPRDRLLAAGLPLAFDAPPPPRGLAALTLPPVVAPGAGFRIGGSVNAVPGGRAELVDPSGQIVTAAPLPASGDFILAGDARVAGPAVFTLRVRDAAGALVETAAVPILTAVQPAPRVLVVAGSAGPDLKYLRRWASDAGIDLKASIAAGNGLDIGDAPPRLDAASLASLDLLVLDERSWAGLGTAQRGAVLAAVRGGLGVLLRVTGPVPDAIRREWATLGLPLGDTEMPYRSPLDSLAEGPGLTRLALAALDSNALPLFSDRSNTPIAMWRGLGRGRIGVWPITNVYALVLAGEPARHAIIWSAVFAALARAQGSPLTASAANAHVGQRLTLCDLAAPATVLHPDGRTTMLVADGACAAFYPSQTGWHTLSHGKETTMFRVTDRNPGLIAAETINATWLLRNIRTPTRAITVIRGPSWPWFAGWLVVIALLWWLERVNVGRNAGECP